MTSRAPPLARRAAIALALTRSGARPPRIRIIEEAQLKPLAGLKVLEFARILAGPWAGQTLADLGADVIKVERPGSGDDTRGWGPPFLEGENGERLDAAYFHSCNRGKRSLAMDFENPEGHEIVRRLAAQSDVVIENFKTGGLAKYGLDYASLKAINPRLIYCSITGFGHDGPYAARAGYDFIVQGMGGAMDLTGEPGGEPQKVGWAVADIFTGIYAVIAIQAALAQRALTGQGAEIDMALLDTQLAVLANQALNFLVSGRSPRRMGNSHPNLVPYQVFQASDGPLIVATGNDRQCWDFCRIIGLAELAEDPRYASNADRVRNREPFIATFRRRRAPASRRVARRAGSGACSRRSDLRSRRNLRRPAGDCAQDALDLPATGARGGMAPTVRSPILIDGEPASPRRRPRGSGSTRTRCSASSASARTRLRGCGNAAWLVEATRVDRARPRAAQRQNRVLHPQSLGQGHKVAGDHVPILIGFQIRSLARSMLGRARHESGLKPAGARGGEIAIVGGDQTYLFRPKPQDFGGAKSGFGRQLVGAHDFGAEDRIPGKRGALGEIEHQRDVSVGMRRDDEPRLQPGKALNDIGPGIETMPSKIQFVQFPGGRLVEGNSKSGQDGLKIFPVEHIQPHETPPPGAHLLHRGLIGRSPCVREGERINFACAIFAKQEGSFASDPASPIHDGAKHVEQQGAGVAERHFMSPEALSCSGELRGDAVRRIATFDRPLSEYLPFHG